MNSHVVVGVGNIYANEALFLAGIHPRRAAGRIGRDRYHRLAAAIRRVLNESITAGGTTLRDFINGVGEPGYFAIHLRVYGRGGEPCPGCNDRSAKSGRDSARRFIAPRARNKPLYGHWRQANSMPRFRDWIQRMRLMHKELMKKPATRAWRTSCFTGLLAFLREVLLATATLRIGPQTKDSLE